MFYAIGGANYTEQDTRFVDLDILKQANKANPKVLFIPLANKDNEKKSNIFKKYYESLGAYVDILYILRDNLNRASIIEAIENCDIIYFSGGSSKILLEYAIKLDFKQILSKYLNSKIICGVSAGAIMMFEKGYSDLESYQNFTDVYNCKMVNGLGIFKGAFCPHYDQSGYFDFNDEIKKYDLSGYAVTNGCAIKFSNNNITVIKNKLSCGAYYFDLKNNHLLEPLR